MSSNIIIELSTQHFEIIEIGPNSHIAIKRNFLPSGELFEKIWSEHPDERHTIKMFGKDVLIPRYQQTYGQSYIYSGTVSKSIKPTEFVEKLTEKLNKIISKTYVFNMCLCNWYELCHYIGLHSDDEKQIIKESPIASLSWGYTRKFRLVPKKPEFGKEYTLDLHDGDLVFMLGSCQTTHKHEIKKIKYSGCLDDLKFSGRRINFTFRCFG